MCQLTAVGADSEIGYYVVTLTIHDRSITGRLAAERHDQVARKFPRLLGFCRTNGSSFHSVAVA
jgi:hypothetical protein